MKTLQEGRDQRLLVSLQDLMWLRADLQV